MEFKPEELIIDTFRSKHQSKGGWSYEPDEGVRIFHKPTGLSSEYEEYKSLHRNKAEALDILYDKVGKYVQKKLISGYFPDPPNPPVPPESRRIVENGKPPPTPKYELPKGIANKFDVMIIDNRRECINVEEQALREYFLSAHNIDIDEMLSLRQNVNNLKFKHFEKRVYPFANEYFFKGECFLTVDYENNEMHIVKHWKRKYE